MSSCLSHRYENSRLKALSSFFPLRSVETTEDTALQHIEKMGLGPGYNVVKGCYVNIKIGYCVVSWYYRSCTKAYGV